MVHTAAVTSFHQLNEEDNWIRFLFLYMNQARQQTGSLRQYKGHASDDQTSPGSGGIYYSNHSQAETTLPMHVNGRVSSVDPTFKLTTCVGHDGIFYTYSPSDLTYLSK